MPDKIEVTGIEIEINGEKVRYPWSAVFTPYIPYVPYYESFTMAGSDTSDTFMTPYTLCASG